MNQKLEFAQRLREAMVSVGLQPRPGVLHNLFNDRYWGTSVSFQAVSCWLKGQAIPAQDKLQLLAEILKVEPEVLRYGQDVRQRVQEKRKRWDEALSFQEREMFDAYLNLPVEQRKVVREVILTFALAHEKTTKAA